MPVRDPCFVVSYVGSAGARGLLAATLARRGYRTGVDCIMAA